VEYGANTIGFDQLRSKRGFAGSEKFALRSNGASLACASIAARTSTHYGQIKVANRSVDWIAPTLNERITRGAPKLFEYAGRVRKNAILCKMDLILCKMDLESGRDD
jgi:hypothetical protein